MSKEIKEILLKLSDDALDHKMKPYIEKWNDDPTPHQILEVLDHCIYGGLTSEFIITLFQGMYDDSLSQNNLTHEEVIKDAHWRNEW